MRVVFGWELDGLSFPETIDGTASHFNSAVAGPLSFISLLETRLGLRRPAVPRAIRVANYLLALRNADDGNRFYSASLAADSWSTSSHVLALRDELVAAGWRRDFTLPGFAKMRDLALVESESSGCDGLGERLQLVNSTLSQRTSKVFEHVSIAGSISYLPPVWQDTLKRLKNSGTAISELTTTLTESDCDLARLQRRLCIGAGNEKLLLQGDGSICLLEADDEMQAALVTASWLRQRGENSNLVIIRGQDSSCLSQRLEQFGLPAIGSTTRSRFRASLQVLALAFEAVCRPADPRKLVELLSIPDGPIPGWIARILIEALHESPGIGGPAWSRAWIRCAERQTDFILREDMEILRSQAEEESSRRIIEWQRWFESRVDTNDPNQEISTKDADHICERVQHWAQRKKTSDRNLQRMYEIVAAQSILLRKILQSVSPGFLPMAQLRKMIDSVSDYGASMADIHAADWHLVDRPAQIWAEAHSVLWWGFSSAAGNGIQKSGWSDEECQALQSSGIWIERPLDRLRRESMGWRMALLNVKKHLLLVKPQTVCGMRAVAHPLWDELESVMDPGSVSRMSRTASDLFRGADLQLPGNVVIRTEVAPPVALPRPLRTWSLLPGALKSRPNESYNSINKMLGCPLLWTLQYQAKMWRPKNLDLPEKQLLLGSLAHTVVKHLFEEKKRWLPEEARDFAADRVQALVPQMAASLLLPGQSPQLRDARVTIPSSVHHLVQLFNEAEVTVEGVEASLQSRILESTNLGGKVDLLIRLPSGKLSVIDFKWTSSPYWFRKQLVEGKALQLAIYSWLASNAGDDEPGRTFVVPAEVTAMAGVKCGAPADSNSLVADELVGGYFMFRQGELFFTGEDVFPEYTGIRRMSRNLSDTFVETMGAFRHNLAKLQTGTVIAKGVIDESLDVFEPASLVDAPCNFCEFGHFCGKRSLR